jgi:hypothetical protein
MHTDHWQDLSIRGFSSSLDKLARAMS